MRVDIVLIAIGALALDSPQERPSPGGNEIVVTAPAVGIDTSGPEPLLRGGQWRFERSALLASGEPGNAAEQRVPSTGSGSGRAFDFSVCLADDSLERALQRLAGDRSALPNPSQFCGRLHMNAGKGRISGRRSCQLVSHVMGRSHSKLNLRLSGRYDPQALRISVYGEEQTDGMSEGPTVPRPATYSWRVLAHRVGTCAAAQGAMRSIDEAADLLFVPGADGSGI